MYVAFLHNNQKSQAPRGMDFGQQLEPAGFYTNVSATSKTMGENNAPGWSAGYIKFENPLVLEHKSTTSNGWKKDLSEMFGGKTGKRLSEAVKKAGYDAIVTYDTDYPSDPFNETVVLNMKRITAAEYNEHRARVK